ncbi:GNAT family N-acetyltransferase [Streptomyces peucetius]|uniref:GNAT family N-acetyltransferase n=1 Tax=Streptomyces peucetius TaxID=1950 RepID=A0ABY6IC48_STRPE|nr:GNAT family N-acetyltransferase [Streptomyces peucetius]UYQ64572.1 GNAT family N-acetyltransferase [Streptomyces peucetius]
MHRQDHTAVLALFDRQLRRDAHPGERDGDVVRQSGDDGDWSGVLWSSLRPDTADAAIARQVRHFSALGRPFEWKLYSYDTPDDLGARLRAAGFVPEAQETVMAGEAARMAVDVELPDGVRLEPVTDAAGVDLVVQVHEQAFGTSGDRLRAQLLVQLAKNADTVDITLAMAGDLPVCSARMERYPGTDFAGLWGGGTLAAWRGRGIYRALVAHRARLAVAKGVRHLQVDASDDSRPILERLGFTALCTTTPYVYEP